MKFSGLYFFLSTVLQSSDILHSSMGKEQENHFFLIRDDRRGERRVDPVPVPGIYKVRQRMRKNGDYQEKVFMHLLSSTDRESRAS